MTEALKSALSDISEGFRLRRVWIALAYEDIGDQHRLTLLGPLWLLINYLAFAGTFVFIFNEANAGFNYAAYVAIGLLVWFFIMETITLSISLFTREESYIKGTTLPLTVYIMRLLMQSAIRASYALVGCLAILLLNGVGLTPAWLWAGAGILMILLVSPAVITICAFMGAYFPDSQYLIGNLMRLGMFITPIFWQYEDTGGVRHVFYHWNPFTYFLEIVRAPILHGTLPVQEFLVSGAIGIAAWAVALLLLGRFRKELVFVV